MAIFGYQTAGGTRLDTNRGIYYRIQASSAGSIVRAFAYIDANSVSVNARAAIYASSAQDLTGVPTGASLGTSSNTAISNASTAPAWVQFDFSIPVVVTSGLYFHLFVGTDNAANWGCWYNDNNADNDSVESTAASNTTVPTTADISGPNTDWDVSFYVETGSSSFSYAASGGIALGGSGSFNRIKALSASGGMQLSGASAAASRRAQLTDGGIQISGEAVQSIGKQYSAEGGLSLAGAAEHLFVVVKEATGGLQFSGSSSASFSGSASYSYSASGGISISGATIALRKISVTPVGGIVLGGVAAYSNSGMSAAVGYTKRNRIRKRKPRQVTN